MAYSLLPCDIWFWWVITCFQNIFDHDLKSPCQSSHKFPMLGCKCRVMASEWLESRGEREVPRCPQCLGTTSSGSRSLEARCPSTYSQGQPPQETKLALGKIPTDWGSGGGEAHYKIGWEPSPIEWAHNSWIVWHWGGKAHGEMIFRMPQET